MNKKYGGRERSRERKRKTKREKGEERRNEDPKGKFSAGKGNE